MSTDESTRYDDIFAEMAGRLGGLPPLMDAFFGFLARRTDFYIVADRDTPAPMGFPEGVSKKILLQSLDKYTFQNYRDTDHYKNSNDAKMTEKYVSNTGKLSTSKMAVPAASVTPSPSEKKEHSTTVTLERPSLTQQSPILSVERRDAVPARPIGNGGLGPGYYWTQTLKEITIYIDLDDGVRKADIQCSIEAKAIDVAINGTTILKGCFEDPIRRSESMWTISSGGENSPQLVLSLEKTRKTWWKSAVIGHPEIDTTKVDSTQSIDEYDEETQATIRRLMIEQKEKRRLESTQVQQLMGEDALFATPGFPLPPFPPNMAL